MGRDMRLSSPAIKEHLLRGLVDQGADVIDIGMVGTDQYYYACATLDRPGAMVTASHNPPEYCGFKMVRQMPYLLSGESGIQDLRRLVVEESWGESQRQGGSGRGCDAGFYRQGVEPRGSGPHQAAQGGS